MVAEICIIPFDTVYILYSEVISKKAKKTSTSDLVYSVFFLILEEFGSIEPKQLWSKRTYFNRINRMFQKLSADSVYIKKFKQFFKTKIGKLQKYLPFWWQCMQKKMIKKYRETSLTTKIGYNFSDQKLH